MKGHEYNVLHWVSYPAPQNKETYKTEPIRKKKIFQRLCREASYLRVFIYIFCSAGNKFGVVVSMYAVQFQSLYSVGLVTWGPLHTYRPGQVDSISNIQDNEKDRSEGL